MISPRQEPTEEADGNADVAVDLPVLPGSTPVGSRRDKAGVELDPGTPACPVVSAGAMSQLLFDGLTKMTDAKKPQWRNSILVLQRFVGLQHELSNALQSSLPAEQDWVHLTDFPHDKARGSLKLSSGTWEYVLHGSGLRFTREKPRMVVDMHQWLSRPDVFDAWRIHLHLYSISWKGERGASLEQRQFWQTLEGSEDWLKALEQDEIVEQVPGLQKCLRLKFPFEKLQNTNF